MISNRRIVDGVRESARHFGREESSERFPEFINARGEAFREVDDEVQMTSTGVTMDWEVFICGRLQGSKFVTILLRRDDHIRRALDHLGFD